LYFNSNSSKKDIINSNESGTGPIFRAPSPDNYQNWTIPTPYTKLEALTL